MNHTAEQRESYRMEFAAKVHCEAKEIGKTYNGLLRNISLTGLFMETEHDLQTPCSCDLRIILEGEHSRLIIDDLNGKIIRQDKDGVAIQFDERLEWLALVPVYRNKAPDQ